ncbi:hypothetical protein XELAEV_18024098mg [Xenopus laevis]|uniref:Uncharacterized protein n=1 Tax=Xenopus laevis TaxID=8355 RepID=A0A974D668_XENLA|nr:hypothetical protein XELAEV_18024098mg [Xenopus laevis]
MAQKSRGINVSPPIPGVSSLNKSLFIPATVCCLYNFNLDIKQLIVEPRCFSIFSPAVHDRCHNGWWPSPMIPSDSEYL